MRVWRLAAARHSPLSGEGAREVGGRWNSPGTAVLYASSTLALAVLEALVHVDVDELPDDLTAHAIEIPDARVERLDPAGLAARWDPGAVLEGRRAFPALGRTRSLGDGWVRAAAALALVVPSAVLPLEDNVLLNPGHAAAAELEVRASHRFAFDPRLGGQTVSG